MIVQFFKTNLTTDPGFTLDTNEVARQFWASDTGGKAWLDQDQQPLERLAMSWIVDNLGSWRHEEWVVIADAIRAVMFRERTAR